MGFFAKPEVVSPGRDAGGDNGARLVAPVRRVARLGAQVAQLTRPDLPPAPLAVEAMPG